MIDQPPREITPFVRRRAWAEPRVRGWWLLAIVLMVLGIYLGLTQYRNWSRLHRAVTSNVSIAARILSSEGDGRARNISPNAPVVIAYEYEGKKFEKEGTLSGNQTAMAVGGVATIHIDPRDPDNWTTRTEVTPLGVELTGAILVLPVAIISLLIAWFSRSAALKTYERGRAVEAVVMSNKQTPLAPRSRAITAAVGQGARTFDVVVPPSLADLAEGDAVVLILPLKSGRALAAAWYEQNTEEF